MIGNEKEENRKIIVMQIVDVIPSGGKSFVFGDLKLGFEIQTGDIQI
jgi:hypothetical protein